MSIENVVIDLQLTQELVRADHVAPVALGDRFQENRLELRAYFEAV